MHREITFADRAFGQESRLSLYLLTALIGLIIGADLWPFVASWLQTRGVPLPTWPNEVGGFRVALVAAVLGGARVLYGSLESLARGRLGADLALAVACVAAILIREPLVAAELVFVGLLGECLENYTFERTRHAVRKLADLTPRRCWRLRDGQEERVLVEDLQVGDRVVIKPGAKVPADGVVLEGRSSLDASALTGESLPADRGPGDAVLAGSLNQQGALTVEVRSVAEQTVLGRVVQMTAQALADRAPAERTADRLARYFLPAVLGLAALTFLVALAAHAWGIRAGDTPRPGLAASIRYAAYPALSVLVVACPCALILATPAAIIAALGRLAGTGILIKGGSALERLAAVDTFAFDKTGTLTEGRLGLGDVVPLAEMAPDEILRLAASVEVRSEHPLARVVLAAARERGIAPEGAGEFLAHTGSGVSGTLAAGRVLVGNVRLLAEMGVIPPDEMRAVLDRLDAAGQTSLIVCLDGRPVGVIGARDRVRPEARAVLDELRALGIGRLVMLTGDRPAAARAVADAVGMSEVYAEQLPQDKAGRVTSWGRVALVGDGVNDAPALAAASVGLAIGGTNDVAAEAGDVVLLVGPDMRPGETPRDPLRHLPFLLRLSRETVRLIRLNIVVFAFGVNLVGVALTAWLWPAFAPAGWYESGPLAAVVYHQLGSLLVLLNSMRLLWFERTPGPRWGRASSRFRSLNTWLENHLDLDKGLHWLMHRARAVAAGLLVALVALWALSGFTAIASDEVGIVRRMGRALDDDLTPGLHWRWPWPIDSVSRIRPDRIRVVEVGFRVLPGARVLPGGGWASVHGGDGLARDADEAVMITGDNNLLEVQGSVRYTVDRPRVYLFEVAQPERTIRNAAESVLREVVAGRTMADLLTSDRARFQADVLTRLERRLRDGTPEGLGVRLEGVSLHDLHPPQEVVPAYHSVTRAMEARDRKVNQAESDRLTRRRGQQAKGEETILQAAADRFARVRMAQARRAEFAARHAARSTPSLADEMALFWGAYEARERGESDETIRRTYRDERRDLLRRQQALTDFRIYWDRIAAALAGRPKILIDADRLPGRRQLWLVPSDPPAAPALPPRRRPTDEP